MSAFVLAAVGFADIGCQRTNGDAATKEPESGLLRVPETEKHLGVLTKGQKFPSVVLFEVVNRSDEPVYLETGRPTCGCLRVLIESGSELAPGGTGRIRMELSTHEREGGGRFAEEVSLFVRKHPPPLDSSKPATTGGEEAAGSIREIPEVHLLRVRGVLEGLALFDDKYVIRERMIAEKRIPPLYLIVYRTEESVPFEVLSVKSSLPQLQFDAGKATTSGTGVSNDCFETRVEVPARLTGDVGNSKGEITLLYRLRAAQGTRKVRALILRAQKDK